MRRSLTSVSAFFAQIIGPVVASPFLGVTLVETTALIATSLGVRVVPIDGIIGNGLVSNVLVLALFGFV